MGIRLTDEPPYPQTQAELDSYCGRFIDVLEAKLGGRLVCVLLCGSWARGEAKPPESDADITVVVDTVDDQVAEGLRQAWRQANMGCANVYGADEVKAMARDALEMYTTNAVVLWGINPFPLPTRADFAVDLARIAETIARDARCLLFYHWLPSEDRVKTIRYVVGKYYLLWALKNVVALRTGVFPRNATDLRRQLVGMPEDDLLSWAETLTEADYQERYEEIGRRLSLCARDWLHEAWLARAAE